MDVHRDNRGQRSELLSSPARCTRLNANARLAGVVILAQSDSSGLDVKRWAIKQLGKINRHTTSIQTDSLVYT